MEGVCCGERRPGSFRSEGDWGPHSVSAESVGPDVLVP